jgi:hypothetical protein
MLGTRYGSDARLAIDNLKKPTFGLPTDPPAGASKIKTIIWEKKVNEYVRKESYLEENLKTLYSLIWGQCTHVI